MVFLQRGCVNVVKWKEKAGRGLVYLRKDDLFCLHNLVAMVTTQEWHLACRAAIKKRLDHHIKGGQN